MANDRILEDMTTEELEKAMGAPDPPPETPPVAPAKETPPVVPEQFEYTAGDGSTYRATTSEDLFKKVTDALNHTKTALKDREHQIVDLKRPAPTADAAEDKYDHAKYLALLEVNGIVAQEYVDTFRPHVREAKESAEATKATRELQEEVLKFYADTDYNKVETPELNAVIRERITAKGRPMNALGLGLTYYELKTEGKIPDASGGKPVTRRTPPPESPSGGGGGSVADEPDVDSMSAKELAAHLRKQGVEVWD